MSNPPIAVSRHHGITVVRDDLIAGGTKTRAVDAVLAGTADHVAYAGPAYGYAQIALTIGARAAGKQPHIFVAKRKRQHPRTREAVQGGACLHEISPGYLTQTQAAARTWAAENRASVIPFGFDTAEFRFVIAARIREALTAVETWWDTDEAREAVRAVLGPTEVWVAAGSGTLSRALQTVYPDAEHHAVAVGILPDAGTATVHQAPETFEQDARRPPPYPSTSNYDAKVWQFAADRATLTDRPLIWNVAS